MDIDHRAHSFGGLGSRIILLGDGTELNSDAADPDSEMFDHDDEDADLDMQVHRGATGESEEEGDAKFSSERSQREDTPAPTSAPHPDTPGATAENPNPRAQTESPSSITTEKSEHTEDTGKATPDTSSISSKSGSSTEAKTMPASDAKATEHETS
jgi:protein phosphatase 2C family protein 2/3